MNATDAHIVIHQDPTTQQVFPLTEGVITLGRESYNDIVLIDPEASRKHAQISFQAGRYVVEDLGSTNGTFVNGRQVLTATTLNPGDVIEIGEMARILYQGPGSDISETVMRAPSTSKDATMAMPEDLATFSESLQPVSADGLTMQEADPQMAMPEETGGVQGSGGSRRYLATFGCLIILVVMACVASVFLLDALAADALYCGPGEGIFELLGFVLECP
jgi:hypothetical protein